jgi:predicted aspartyl protease
MLIPKLEVVISSGGMDRVLRGSADTGYDGVAVLRPQIGRQLNLPVVGTQKLQGFGGKLEVPIARADRLYLKGSPNCVLTDAQINLTEIPGVEEILLGEGFFKQFAFDIEYREGVSVIVACGQKISTWDSITSAPWFAPAAVVGGIMLLSFVGNLLSPEPRRYRR